MTEASPPQTDGARLLSFRQTIGHAALVGILGGVLFAAMENVHRIARMETEATILSVADALAAAGQAALTDIVVLSILLVVVGAGTWVALRSRGRKPQEAAVLGVAAAALGLLLVHVVLKAILGEASEEETSSRVRKLADMAVWVASLLCAVGIGYAVRGLRLGVTRPQRLFATLLGILCGLLLWSTWSFWLAAQPKAVVEKLSGALVSGGVLVVALVFAAAVQQAALALLGRRQANAKRRAIRGAALLAAFAALLAGGTALIARAAEAAASQPHGTAPKGAPNVLLIVMDAARADILSCYGNPRATSPHLDKFAREGTLFEQAYTVSPWTLPSHSSIFTGKLIRHHGATGEHMWLDDRNVTLAEILRDRGYRTFSASANGHISPKYNMVQGFEAVETAVYGRRTPSFFASQLTKFLGKGDYGARDTNRLAMQWFARCKKAGQPFFVFLNYMEVHARYGSTPYRGRWLPDGKALKRALKVPQEYIGYAAGARKGTREDFQLLRALYDGDMSYLDERIGQILEYLREIGSLDDTLVIVTSDHGDEIGEHGLLAHSFEVYNTMLHIPLIIRYPKAFAPGTRAKQIVRTTDFFPTILDACGIAWERSPEVAGRSLLDKTPAPQPTYVVSERYLPVAWAGDISERFPRWQGIAIWRRLRSVLDGQFKYIWSSDGDDRLFDLRSDFGETTNLIEKMPEKARELKAVLTSQMGRLEKGAEGPE